MLRSLSVVFGSLVLVSSLLAAPSQLQQRSVLTIASSPEWALSRSTISSNGQDFLLVRMEANVLRWWRISPAGELRDDIPGDLRLAPFAQFPVAQVISNGRDFLILWPRNTDANRSFLEYVRISAQGQLLDPEPQVLADVPWPDRDGPLPFRAASDGDRYLVVWPAINEFQLRGAFVSSAGSVTMAIGPLATFSGVPDAGFDVAFTGPDYVLVWNQPTELQQEIASGCGVIGNYIPPRAWNLFARTISPEGRIGTPRRITEDRRSHVKPRLVVNGPALTVFFESVQTCIREQRVRRIFSLDSMPEPGRVFEIVHPANSEAAFVAPLAGLAVAAFTVSGDIRAFVLDPSGTDIPDVIFLNNDPQRVEVVSGVASAGRTLAIVNNRSVVFFTLPRARGIRR